ncbi:MAG: LysM peptidoglycan-binding domain-containing protein [Cyclobacteriaceae bacterium]|nr:MAG: LysM peptidoglycan-binding domain-containing protein [Cyclobacteriaceae bacterium]
MAEAKAKSDENGMYGPEEEDKSKDEEEPEQSKNAPREHIVRTGENLSTISKRYKISLSDLKNINGIGKNRTGFFQDNMSRLIKLS